MAFHSDQNTHYTVITTEPAAPFTVCGWAQIGLDRNFFSTVWCWDAGNPPNAEQSCYPLQTDSDGTTLGLYNGSGFTGAFSLTVGTWFFWAVTVDGSNNCVVYCATSPTAATSSASGTLSGATPDRFVFHNNSFGEFLNGYIDNIMIFDSVLSAAQVEQCRFTRKPVIPPWAWYPGINKAIADSVVDYSGNGRNLTAGGTIDSTFDGAPVGWGAATPEAVTVPGGAVAADFPHAPRVAPVFDELGSGFRRRAMLAALLAVPPAVDTVLHVPPAQAVVQDQLWEPPPEPIQRRLGVAAITAVAVAAKLPPREELQQFVGSLWQPDQNPPQQRPFTEAALFTPLLPRFPGNARWRAGKYLWPEDDPPQQRQKKFAAILAPTPPLDSRLWGVPRQRLGKYLWPEDDPPQQRRPVSAATIPSATFNLTVAGNGRYLLNNGQPWPFLCRTSWALVTRTLAQIGDFADDCVAKGFTAVEFGAIWRDPRSTQAPFANNGALLPFTTKIGGGSWDGTTTDPDFATTNASYWNFVESVIDLLASKGLVAFMFPCYHGHGGSDGWFAEMIANGESACQTFGAFVANRFVTKSNIVWGLGGDLGTANNSNSYSTSQRNVERGLINGLRSVGSQASHQYAAEWGSGSIAADQGDFLNGSSAPTFGDACTIQSYYDFAGDMITWGRNAYSASPVKPAWQQEGPFDGEGGTGEGDGAGGDPTNGSNDNPNATQPVRRFQWWAWTSGIAGHNFGNGYIWRFNLTGTPPGSDDYRNHTNTATTQDVARLNAFIKSIGWYKLVPSGLDGMRTLVVVNAGTGTQSITAACASDGTYLVAYRPPDHTGSFSVDFRSMAGTSIVQWYDPTTGSLQSAGSPVPNSAASQSFTVPGNNGAGDTDWVLLASTSLVDPPVVGTRDEQQQAQPLWLPLDLPTQPQRKIAAAIATAPAVAQVPIGSADREAAVRLWVEEPRAPQMPVEVALLGTPELPPFRAPPQTNARELWAEPVPPVQPRPTVALLGTPELPPLREPQQLSRDLWSEPAVPAQPRPNALTAIPPVVASQFLRAPAQSPRDLWSEPDAPEQRRTTVLAPLAPAPVVDTRLYPLSSAGGKLWPPDDPAQQRRPAIAALLAAQPPGPDQLLRPIPQGHAQGMWVDPLRPQLPRQVGAVLGTPPLPPLRAATAPQALDLWAPLAPASQPARLVAALLAPVAPSVVLRPAWMVQVPLAAPEVQPTQPTRPLAAILATNAGQSVLRPAWASQASSWVQDQAPAQAQRPLAAVLAPPPVPPDSYLGQRQQQQQAANLLLWTAPPADPQQPRPLQAALPAPQIPTVHILLSW